jgi:hypothetical protein
MVGTKFLKRIELVGTNVQGKSLMIIQKRVVYKHKNVKKKKAEY